MATIGALIELPASGPQTVAGDRLDELARWWAAVAGTPGPRRVDQLWLPGPDPTPVAAAEVVTHPLDAPSTVAEAIGWGMAEADRVIDAGTDLLLVSLHPQDRDEISWQVLATHLLSIPVLTATGWPTTDRIDDRAWVERVAAVRDGLRSVRALRNEPEQLLAVLGVPALAAGTGLLLQAAARRTPALLDGPGAAACALLAHRSGRSGRYWWQATDAGGVSLHDRVLTDLRLTPFTRLGLLAEDGTGARLSLGLLETALTRSARRADDHSDPAGDPDQPAEPDSPDLSALALGAAALSAITHDDEPDDGPPGDGSPGD